MATAGSYPIRSFSESQTFLVMDPSTSTVSRVRGSDLIAFITPNLNVVRAESTTDGLINEDYKIGSLVQTTGQSAIGDGLGGLFLVVASGEGDVPMLNGNDLLTIAGDAFLRDQLNNGIVRFDSLSDMEGTTGRFDGDAAYMVGRVTAGDGGEGNFRWDSSDLSSTLVLSSVTSTSVDDATDTITSAGHGLSNGDGVVVQTDVNGLSINTVYWVVNAATDTFQLSETFNGVAFDLTGTTNFTSDHLLDPMRGAYITAPDDLTGQNGAWVREIEDDVNPDWFDGNLIASVRFVYRTTQGTIKASGGGSYQLSSELDVPGNIMVDLNRSTVILTDKNAFISLTRNSLGAANNRYGGIVNGTISGNGVADFGLYIGVSVQKEFANLVVTGCVQSQIVEDGNQNCKFSNVLAEGGEIPWKWLNGTGGNEHYDCHSNAVAGTQRVFFSGADTGSKNYADNVALGLAAAPDHNKWFGIMEYGKSSTDWIAYIEAGKHNVFFDSGFNFEQGEPSISQVGCIYLGPDTRSNSFHRPRNNMAALATVGIEDRGEWNSYNRPDFRLRASASALIRYYGHVSVVGLADDIGVVYSPDLLFDNQTGGDAADYLSFTPNALSIPDAVADAFETNGSAALIYFGESDKSLNIIDGPNKRRLTGRRIEVFSHSFGGATIPDGATENITVSATGVPSGTVAADSTWVASAAFPYGLQGMIYSVSAVTNGFSLSIYNGTGASKTLASGSINVVAEKI